MAIFKCFSTHCKFWPSGQKDEHTQYTNVAKMIHLMKFVFKTEKYEVEIVRQGGKKIMPSKLQFDHQNKEVKNKQEESREATTLKLDRWDSMQYLTPNCKCFIIH